MSSITLFEKLQEHERLQKHESPEKKPKNIALKTRFKDHDSEQEDESQLIEMKKMHW